MSSRKLRFESLERREVCAGNVTARVVNGDLVVTGDAAANEISIQQESIGGTSYFTVFGIPFNGKYDSSGAPVMTGNNLQPTTISNASEGNNFAAFPSAGLGLKVNLNGGNDVLYIGGNAGSATLIVKDLKISAGAQDDYVVVDGVHVTSVAGQLDFVQTTQAISSTAAGQAEAGRDRLFLDHFQYLGHGTLTLGTGGGNDGLYVRNTISQGTITQYLGLGNDAYLISGSNFGTAAAKIYGGGGQDIGAVENSKLRTLFVDLGAGDNELLQLTAVAVTTKATLHGGAGVSDHLRKVGTKNNLGPSPVIDGFEVIE